MLERGLERLEDAKTAPLKAADPHELGRCLDVKSIFDNAEVVVRSSLDRLERQESRPVPFGFNRVDYPEQDDENWKVFLAARRDPEGRFEFRKIPTET